MYDMKLPKKLKNKLNAAPPRIYEEITKEWCKKEQTELKKDRYQIHYSTATPASWQTEPWHVWYTEEYEQRTAEEKFERWAIKKGIKWTGYKIMKNGEWTSPTT